MNSEKIEENRFDFDRCLIRKICLFRCLNFSILFLIRFLSACFTLSTVQDSKLIVLSVNRE